jgi:signal transduction histidine kinase
MQAWLTRMYERHRSRYVIAAMVAVTAEVLLVAVPVMVAFPTHYEQLTLSQALVATLIGWGVTLFGEAVALVRVWPDFRAVLRWSRDGSVKDEAAAREFAFDGARRIVVVGGLSAAPGVFAVVAAITIPSHHTSALDWVELTVGALGAALAMGLNAWFYADILTLPVRAKLSAGPEFRERSTSLMTRLGLVAPVTWIAGGAVGYLTGTRAQAGAGHLLVGYGIAVVITAFALNVLGPLLTSGFLQPVREITTATRAVAAGHLDTRVPVATRDELGELAASFNVMLDEVRDSRARIVAASDAARRKVERDLHDGAQQRLVLLSLKAAVLERERGHSALVSEIRQELEQALAELRDLAHGIYPTLLETDGLRAALAEVAGRAGIPTTVDCNGAGRYPRELEAAVYFCCLEALQNAAKHAGEGARATVLLGGHDGTLSFEVIDDGRGFDPTMTANGSGLQNMTDRIGALGGTVRIDSAPGRGTTVAGEIPIAG